MILLILVAALGTGMAAFGELYSRAERREKERELLHIGNEFRRAIASYHQVGKTYPKALDDLVEDKRFSPIRRHLRRVYRDPLTASSDWGLVEAPGGGIMGVHSLSEEEPVKTGNFAERDAEFAGAASYRDWSFTYRP